MKMSAFFCGVWVMWFAVNAAFIDRMTVLQDEVVAHPFDRTRLYNLGVEAAKNQDWQKARESFSCAKTVADSQQLDALHGEQLFYNAGNVEMKLADYGEAEKSFDAVLQYNPANEKARQKRDLARQLKEKKEQQQSSSDEKNKSEQQKQDDAKSDETKSEPQNTVKNDQQQSPHEKSEDQDKKDAKDQAADKKQQNEQRAQSQPRDEKQNKSKGDQRKDGSLDAKQQAAAGKKNSSGDEEEKEGKSCQMPEQQLTEQEQMLLQRVDEVDRANAKNWLRLQTQQMGNGYDQHKW